jgi:hypothetical protein
VIALRDLHRILIWQCANFKFRKEQPDQNKQRIKGLLMVSFKTTCMKKTIGIALCVFLLALGCSKSSDDKKEEEPPATTDCSTVTTTFAANVSPLILSSCSRSDCHGRNSINGPGELTTYAQIFGARAQIRAAVASGSMPKGATLTAAQKATITCWIDSGAPNN